MKCGMPVRLNLPDALGRHYGRCTRRIGLLRWAMGLGCIICETPSEG